MLVILLALVLFCSCLDNGAAPKPPMGWSSWMVFRFNVSASGLKQMCNLMVTSGMKAAGYNYILLDDGWPSCLSFAPDGRCAHPGPRDPHTKRIIADPAKFPNGLKEVTDYCHSMELKVGIYTAPHKVTCGKYTASLNYEVIDAQAFADWGIDFVKLDAGCQMDCSLHNGCLLDSLTRMRDGLNATGRKIVYYIDDGNPTSGPKVFNPFQRGWPNDEFTKTHIATKWSEFVGSWGPDMANMWKIWFDRQDNWYSLLDNVHQQVGMQWFQKCGAFNNPDFLTVGQGGMTQGQYRAEMFLYAVLGAPLIVSFDLANIDHFTRDLVTNPEILAINQDPDCVQGSNVKAYTAVDMWIRPLADKSFAVALVNKDPVNIQQIDLIFGDPSSDDHSDSDFFPVGPIYKAQIRDVYNRRNLGTFQKKFTQAIPPLDAVLLRVYPQYQPTENFLVRKQKSTKLS